MKSQPTVFIVEDDPALRVALRQLVESVGLQAVTFSDARECLEVLTPDSPGCIVADLRLPGMSGLELHKVLTARGIRNPVIVTTGYGDVSTAVEAMKVGVFDFIEKPFPLQRMLVTIQHAVAQDRSMRESHARDDGVRTRMAELSRREREVLRLVAAGLASSDIASKLGIQTKTVEVHRSHINKKMQARNVADLVRMVHSIEANREPQPRAGEEIECL